MKKPAFLLVFATLLFAFTSEDDLVQNIVAKFDHYNNELPQEKAYLHLDKPYYTAGETVWF